jgi:hypothetical protein
VGNAVYMHWELWSCAVGFVAESVILEIRADVWMRRGVVVRFGRNWSHL